MRTVGLVVNPAAGRDIRRITGSTSVSDNYSKRQVATSVLAGIAGIEDTAAVVIPDKAGLGQRAIEDGPTALDCSLLDGPVAASGPGTQNAVEQLQEVVDAIVVLGGDGTTRDVAIGLDGTTTPVLPVSTGTNNVVPTHVDGTVAGLVAALVASETVPVDAVTIEHGMVEAIIEGDRTHAERRLRSLATLGVLDVPFTGTRAVLRGRDFVGGVVSRAHPADIGLSGIAGALAIHRPGTPGGIGLRLAEPERTDRQVQAITVPGVIDRIGIRAHRRLDPVDSMTFELQEGTLSVDGERELELVDAHVTLRTIPTGPRIIDVDSVFERGVKLGIFSHMADRSE